MKKLIAVVSAFALFALFVGCGGGDDDKIEPTLHLMSTSTSVLVGEVFTVNCGVSGVEEIAGLGVKIVYDPFKLQILEMTREDSFLTSNGGNVQQMEFATDNTAGNARIVLAVFPTANAAGDASETVHNFATLRVKALSSGSATMTLNITNEGSLTNYGVWDAAAAPVSMKLHNYTVNINN